MDCEQEEREMKVESRAASQPPVNLHRNNAAEWAMIAALWPIVRMLRWLSSRRGK